MHVQVPNDVRVTTTIADNAGGATILTSSSTTIRNIERFVRYMSVS